MHMPFNLNDVRFVSIDGNTVRFDLPTGHVEVTFDSTEVMQRILAPKSKGSNPRHQMYQDGIFGL
jgi:hypothetical protein